MSPAPARVDELKKRYDENPRRFFAPLANEYRKAGDLDAAIDLCRMHLEEQPGHLSGHIVYGQALFESGRAAEAKTAFDAALGLDPENLIALRHLGDIGRADGDMAVAAHWYQRVLEADPRNDEVIALIASLQDVPVHQGVVVDDEPPPPPAPGYGFDEPVAADVPLPDSSAPTPVVPLEAVAASAIDVALAPDAAPGLDAASARDAAPAQDAAPAHVATPPAIPPRLSIGLMDLDLDLGEVSQSDADLLGTISADQSAEVPEAQPPVEVFDTSFDVELPLVSEPTFASAEAAPEFGDSLDVTAEADAMAEPAAAEAEPAAAETEPAAAEAEPVAVEAGPTAPTPGDFDLMFGNEPISDVFVGGDGAPVATDDPGFVADAFIGREPVDEVLDTASDAGTTPPPFVTETMAELYLQQGFRDEALAVYRQLLAQDPSDAGLAERVLHLEHGARSSMAIDRVSQEIEQAVEDEEHRKAAGAHEVPAPASEAKPEPMPAVEAAAAPAVEPAAAPPVEPEPAVAAVAFETVPAFMVEAPVAASPARPIVPAGPTAREIFGRIAQRRARPGGAEPGAGVEVHAEPAPTVGTAAAEPAASAIAASRGGIDDLFGAGSVNTEDETAAVAMASAFSAAPAAPAAPAATVTGQPTYAGTDELSLDSVFHGEVDATRSAPAVERQSTKLRFDQFFPDAADAAASPSASPSEVNPPATPAAGDDDSAQFSDWLKGLKGS